MQCIALFCLSSCCYIHFAGLIFPHLCRRLCGMAVLAEFFFFFCKGSLLWQRTGTCAPSLLNFTRTRNCPYPEAFLFVYWLVWQVYITQRCCYFAAQFFFLFFFFITYNCFVTRHAWMFFAAVFVVVPMFPFFLLMRCQLFLSPTACVLYAQFFY